MHPDRSISPAELPAVLLAVLLAVTLAVTLGGLTISCQAPAEQSGSSTELGTLGFYNSGSAKAQEPFLRGLAALHSFWYEEAIDQFRRAQETDEDFAMAYWGEALSHTQFLWNREDVQAARSALRRLGATAEERAAKAPTPRERDYLGTVEALYGEGDRLSRYLAYARSMKRLADSYPEDEDAVALHALTLQLVTRPFERNQTRIRSAALLEDLAAKHPRHPGVLHYLLHAYDDPILAPLGLRAASVYAKVAPAAHHARHMPSHIFLQLGLWDRVASSNEDAFQVSVDSARRKGLGESHHDFHSLSWLAYAYLQQGRYESAEDTLRTLQRAARAGAPAQTHTSHELGPQQNFHEMTGRYLLETRRWSSSSLSAPSAPSAPSGTRIVDTDLGGTNASLVLAVALAAVELDELPRARQAAALLATLRAGEEKNGNQELAARLAVMERQATGTLALKEGRTQEALQLLQEAAGIETRLPLPSGPPHPVKPAQELLGEVLLELRRPRDAAQVFEFALLRTPRRALALLGSARAALASGDPETARTRYQELLDVWKQADPGVEGLEEARIFVASPS